MLPAWSQQVFSLVPQDSFPCPKMSQTLERPLLVLVVKSLDPEPRAGMQACGAL